MKNNYSQNQSLNLDESLIIDIYFNRKNSSVRVLIERWVLKLTSDKGGGDNTTQSKSNNPKFDDYFLDPLEIKKSVVNTNLEYSTKDNLSKVNYKKYRKIFAVKKLSTFLRTVYVYSRSLPAFELFLKTGFDYTLEFSCSSAGEQNLSNFKKSFKHKCDINIGLVTFEVHYIEKNEIFNMEQLAKSQQEKVTHHRHFSERVVTHIKPEDETELDLKRVSSRSLDKYKLDKEEDSLNNFSIMSDLDTDENHFLIKDFNELINFGMEKEKNEISKLNLKIRNMKKEKEIQLMDSQDDYITSEDSDYDTEDYWNVYNSEEILEISDDSSNFYLQEELETKLNKQSSLDRDLFLTLRKFKKEMDKFPKLKMNVISLYECVNKN